MFYKYKTIIHKILLQIRYILCTYYSDAKVPLWSGAPVCDFCRGSGCAIWSYSIVDDKNVSICFWRNIVLYSAHSIGSSNKDKIMTTIFIFTHFGLNIHHAHLTCFCTSYLFLHILLVFAHLTCFCTSYLFLHILLVFAHLTCFCSSYLFLLILHCFCTSFAPLSLSLSLSLSFQRSLPVMGYSSMMHCSQSPGPWCSTDTCRRGTTSKTASLSLSLSLPKGQVHSVIQGTVGRLSSELICAARMSWQNPINTEREQRERGSVNAHMHTNAYNHLHAQTKLIFSGRSLQASH